MQNVPVSEGVSRRNSWIRGHVLTRSVSGWVTRADDHAMHSFAEAIGVGVSWGGSRGQLQVRVTPTEESRGAQSGFHPSRNPSIEWHRRR